MMRVETAKIVVATNGKGTYDRARSSAPQSFWLGVRQLLDTVLAQEVKSYVCVESNTGTMPDQNSDFAFSNDGVGSLTALPGSP